MNILKWFIGLFNPNNNSGLEDQIARESVIRNIAEENNLNSEETLNRVLNEDDEFLSKLDLESEKYKAINACDGCESEVFVLKKSGKEIGYYPNLHQLAIKNNFEVSPVYRYWKNKDNRPRKGYTFLDSYEILKLS